MPVYSYKCDKCCTEWDNINKVAARADEVCRVCGRLATLILSIPGQHISFRSGFFEHIAPDPIYINSKQKLKDECNKRNLTSPYAWD